MKLSDISEAEIIKTVAARERGGPTPDVALASKYPVKLILKKMGKLVDKGLLEYGVSLRFAWLTDKCRIQFTQLT